MSSQAGADSTGAPDPTEVPFEQALARLETIVERLEAGDLALEDALEAFEEGVGLSRRLGAQLAGAERRVELLLEEGGSTVTRDFDTGESV